MSCNCKRKRSLSQPQKVVKTSPKEGTSSQVTKATRTLVRRINH